MCIGGLKEWNDFIIGRSKMWEAYFRGWVVNAQQPTLVIRWACNNNNMIFIKLIIDL